MTPRMTIALSSLVSALVATYLHLWKLGKVGALACTGNHGCEIAQFSSYGWFLGIDVALIGAVGYALILAVALWGIAGSWNDSKWPSAVLTALIVFGVLFTIRLKYGEWIVLGTFCPWCFVNVFTITLNAAMVTMDWRRLGRERDADTDEALATA
jgi:uncharacterized membrane protein